MNNLNKKQTQSFPSIQQGKKYKKYQTKIYKNIEKKLERKEGFQNLTGQTNDVLENYDYSNNSESFDDLRNEYDKTLKEYQDLNAKILGNVSSYFERISSNNPYLNKTVQFPTGEMGYVTNQGVFKYIPSLEIQNSVNIPKTIVPINVEWKENFARQGSIIPVKPQLITGTAMKFGQKLGNEGSNVFVNQLLPNDINEKYIGCYASNEKNTNMSFIGGTPQTASNLTIVNGNFQEPVLNNNTYKYITGSSVPGWYFNNAVLLNNSKSWGYSIPYPNGNQCVSIQNTSYINTIVKLQTGITYQLLLYACSRNCCESENNGNTINIDLYTNLDAYISQIASFTADINVWNNYSFSFTVPSNQSYKIQFTGTNSSGDRSTAIQNISINGDSTITGGTFTYDSCKETAIANGYRYFGIQNANTTTGLGYCAVSNSEPATSQYGESVTTNEKIVLWSSNTSGQNTAILSNTGSLQVVNSNGQVIYGTPANNAFPSNYIGCYNDKDNSSLPSNLGANMTYETCQSAAKNGGLSYFGLQNLQPDGTFQCFGGNEFSTAISLGKADNCTVSNNITVGGGNSNAIYNTNLAQSNYFLFLDNDGNMTIYRGNNSNDKQGKIWSSKTKGQKVNANPDIIASKGKYGQNWMGSGSTLSPGDFIGSNDGTTALIMQSDGNLVLYAYKTSTNCKKVNDKMVGGESANAVYDIGVNAIRNNIGKVAYINENSVLYNYPDTNIQYSNTYTTFQGIDSPGNDIPDAAFGGATFETCQKACNDNDECAGFVSSADGTYCYPKTKNMYPFSQEVTVDKDKVIYVRNKAPSALPDGVGADIRTIDTITYGNYIQSDKNMDDNITGLTKITDTQKKELEQLQTRLNLISSQLNKYTNQFKMGTDAVEQQSIYNNNGIDKYLNEMKNVVVQKDSMTNIQNILTDTDLLVLQKNYSYLFWSILAIGTVLVSINVMNKK